MQVGTQARTAWQVSASVSAWAAVTRMLVIIGIGVVMALLLTAMMLRGVVFAIRKRFG